MRFFRGRRSPRAAGGEQPGRPPGPPDPPPPSGLPVTDPGLPGRLTAAFGASSRRRPVTVDTLTLGDVTGYFAGRRPADPRVRAGALLAAAHPGGRQVFQVFLDEADRVCADASGTPYGRQVIARRLDGELLDYLGGSSLLIFR